MSNVAKWVIKYPSFIVKDRIEKKAHSGYVQKGQRAALFSISKNAIHAIISCLSGEFFTNPYYGLYVFIYMSGFMNIIPLTFSKKVPIMS